MVGHLPVTIGVLQVRAAHADEGLDVVGPKFNGVGAHVLHRAQQTGLDVDFLGATAAESEIALQVHKLRHHQGGVADLRLDHGAVREVQEDGRCPGGHGQALRAKAAHKVHRRDDVGRVDPARAPVQADIDVAAFELEDIAATQHAEVVGRGTERREFGHLFHHAAGGRHDGQGHIHVFNGDAKGVRLLVHRQVGVKVGDAVTDEDVGIGDAQRHGFDFEVGQGGPVARELNARSEAGRLQRRRGGGKGHVTKARARVHRDALAQALFEGERALHVNELTDPNGRVFNVHAHQRAVECDRDGQPARGHRQTVHAIGGLEVDKRLDLGVGPRTALVGGDANAIGFERQEIQPDKADLVHRGGQCPQIRHVAQAVGIQDQTQVQVVHHETGGIGRGLVGRGDLVVAVAVHKIRTCAHKQHRV